MIRPLVIGPTERAAAQTVVDFASQPEHWYHPLTTGPVPGDDPRYVLDLAFGFRCVFSHTTDGKALFRQLSISVSDPRKLPNPFAAFTIAEVFGFSGWDGHSGTPPRDWLVRIDDGARCVVLGQRIGDVPQ